MRIISKDEYLARTGQDVMMGDCFINMGNDNFAYTTHDVIVAEVPIKLKYSV